MLWLAGARRKLRERPRARHAEVRRWWGIARARLGVAERLDPKTEIAAIVPLLREGLMGLAGAAVAATEGTPTSEDVANFAAAWATLERVWPALGVATPLADFAAAKALVLEQLPVDAPPPKDAAEGVRAAERLARAVERAIDPRRPRLLLARAVLQVAALAALVVGVAAATIPPLFAPRDLALHKPVRTSSVHPDSIAPANGEWLVNGRVERIYGFATNNEQNPWVVIDLEEDAPIRRIVVYNRGDGWLSDCLPLEVSVGDDLQKLRRVGWRDTIFTQFSPWTLHTDTTARYVKLTVYGHVAFALSEVEVYSR